MKAVTIIKIVAGIFAVLFLAFAALMGIGAYQYVDAIPEITVNGPVHAAPGTTLQITELADIELEKTIAMGLWFPWDETTPDTAYISDDHQSLYVGDSEGTFEVGISATGEKQEHREATVTIIVTQPE